MKAIIITRAVNENIDSEKLTALLSDTEVLKIALNKTVCTCDIRLFLDWFIWDKVKGLGGQLMTISTGLKRIPEEFHKDFIFFNGTKMPCTADESELLVCNSSLDTAIDLAFKIGVTDLLLIADNNIIEDDISFFKGFLEGIKMVTDFYNTKMNVYQFSKGNFNLPVMDLESFIKL